MDSTGLAREQLARMRGMTAMYHRQFFRDINVTAFAVIALLLVGWWQITEAFLLLPVVALIGAVQTAFDSSYLIFARRYAASLERHINEAVGRTVLIGSRLEDVYLFPLDEAKIVTIPLRGGFSWFSLVTVFYTVLGMSAYAFGLVLGWDALTEAQGAIGPAYLVSLGCITVGVVLVGLWWFVGGEGERRLSTVLDAEFGAET